MQKKWQILPIVPNDWQQKFPEIPPVILQLLYNRKLDSQEKIDEFINPDYSQDLHDPFLFNDMRKAMERLHQALNEKEKIVIHGDYDADGVSATVIIFNVLKKSGFENLDIYLPHREKEGYGINLKTIEFFKKQKINLIITCDCGISNKLEIAEAGKAGIETIITDHHSEPAELPQAVAIINPTLKNENYPFKNLAGSGVAFKFAQAILREFAVSESETFAKWLLDLVAIGTIADVSPITGENRTLVKYGLTVVAKSKRLGLQKLIEIAGIKREKINTYTIGYQIAPRINSAGRIDHANTAFKLLSTTNLEESIVIANELNKNNQERQKLTEQIFNEASKQIAEQLTKNLILFAKNEKWNPGVVGLVAGKICQEHHRPTFVFGSDGRFLVGSGRSIPEFNIIEAINGQKDLLERFGGHPGACGLSVKAENYSELIENLTNLANQKLKDFELLPFLKIDAEITINDLNWDLVDWLDKFEPFGDFNPKPKFLIKNLLINDLNLVGSNNQHLKIKVADEQGSIKKAIIFNCEKLCPNLQLGELVDLVFEITVNHWNGSKEIELNCQDLKKVN